MDGLDPFAKHPDPSRLWKNRRRMAWASLIAALAYPLLTIATASDQLAAIAAPFYFFTGAVVAAYIGCATFERKEK